MANVFVPLLKALLRLAFTSSLFMAQNYREVAHCTFWRLELWKRLASRLERLVVPVDVTMMAVFCKRHHSVHHVGLPGEVHHVELFGEVEPCDVLTAVFVPLRGLLKFVPLATVPSWHRLGVQPLWPGLMTCCVLLLRSTTWSHDSWSPVSIVSAKTDLIVTLQLLLSSGSVIMSKSDMPSSY